MSKKLTEGCFVGLAVGEGEGRVVGDDVGSSVTGDLLGLGVGGTRVGGAGDGGKTGVLLGTTSGSASYSMGGFSASPVPKLTHKLIPSSYAPLQVPLIILPIPRTGIEVIRISLLHALFSPSKENFSDLSPFEADVCWRHFTITGAECMMVR